MSEVGQKFKKTRLIIAVTVIVSVVALTACVNSPEKKAAACIVEGEKYLSELSYDEAYAKFAEAVQLAPDNAEVSDAVTGYLNEVLNSAESADGREQCEKSIEQIDAVLAYSDSFDASIIEQISNEKEKLESNIEVIDTLEKADSLLNEGKYSEAKAQYDAAKAKGVDESKYSENYALSEAYQRLVDLCDGKSWEDILALVDSQEFDVVMGQLSDGATLYLGADKDIIVGKSGSEVFVISGDVSESNPDGTAIGVISSANSYAIYDGSWKELKPDGEGTVRIWNKRDTIDDAITITGTFAEGLINGTASYTGGAMEDTPISATNGNLDITGVDQDGKVQIPGDKGGYVIDGIATKDGAVDGYALGVPGFGGSDTKIEVAMLDSEPPVLKCGLSVSKWKTFSEPYGGGTIKYADGKCYNVGDIVGYNITATDNIDGDLTAKIESTSTKGSPKTNVGWGLSDHPLTVKYTVTDSAGNTASMTVSYFHQNECEIFPWYVMSISHNTEVAEANSEPEPEPEPEKNEVVEQPTEKYDTRAFYDGYHAMSGVSNNDRNTSCYICSIAMQLTTMGVSNATPMDVYKANGNSSYINSWDDIAKTFNVGHIDGNGAINGSSDEKKSQIIELCKQYPQGIVLMGPANTRNSSGHAVYAFLDNNGTLRINDPYYYQWKEREIGVEETSYKDYSNFFGYHVYYNK